MFLDAALSSKEGDRALPESSGRWGGLGAMAGGSAARAGDWAGWEANPGQQAVLCGGATLRSPAAHSSLILGG